MKLNFLLLLFTFIAFADCTKNDNDLEHLESSNNSSAMLVDTTRVPINDLGTGTYRGFIGGLYPGGANIPSGQYAKDLRNFALSIQPLDSSGVKDSGANGKIVFISLGGSTGGKLMVALIEKTVGNSATNPFLKLVSCSNGYGSGSFNSIMNPNDPYWQHVDQVLKGNLIGRRQVQVIYIESEDSTKQILFPFRAYRVRNEFEAGMRVCKIRFPNAKLVYVEGRTTTFNKKEIPNREPNPYYNGWGEKFAIQDQIKGVSGTQYKGDSAVAPLVTWAWYQWANGTATPRKDGFVWQQSNTEDGLHATDAGEDTLSTRFQNFLLTDRYANIWYANHTKAGK
jgi:hypothetical protein